MRSVDFSDGFTSSGAPTGNSIGATGFTGYATDAAYVSAKGSAAANGDAYYNSTWHVLRCYVNSNWISVHEGAPNFIINGNFDHWQRGTSSTGITSTTRSYGNADRWCAWVGSAATSMAYSRSTLVPTPTVTGAGSKYSFNFQRTAGNTGTTGAFIAQAIETLVFSQLQGKLCTLSFWAKAGTNFSAASSQMEVLVQTGTGTDEVPSSAYTGAVSQVASVLQTISTTWTRYQFTFTFPTTATEAKVRFGFYGVGTAGADDSISIAQVMLAPGGQDRPFTYHGGSSIMDLRACQRYYEKSYAQGVDPATSTSVGAILWRASGTSVEYVGRFQVPKRIALSTITLYSTDGTAANIRDVTGAANAAATTSSTYTGDTGFFAQKTTAGTDQSLYAMHFTSAAEI